MKALAVALLACACELSHSGETEFRNALQAEIQSAFERGDYQAIEKRYAAALATSERTPAGLYAAEVVRKALVVDLAKGFPAENYWVSTERKFDDWASRFPNSSLVAISQSWTYLAHGWTYRGTGYANSVSREGREKLQVYLKKGFDVLMAREKIGRQKDPYWYAQMLNVAQAQGWKREDFIGLLQESTQAFPKNYDIYFAAASNLQPRWGGSVQAMSSLADYAVTQTRQADGQGAYARIFWQFRDGIDTELGGPDVDWKRIRSGFDDIVKRYPDRVNLNQYASMACAANDMPTARKVLLRVKGDLDPDAWADRATYLRCVDAAGLKREQLR